MNFDPATLSMTEIIRLQNLLSQELARRFETTLGLGFTDIVGSTAYFSRFGDEAGRQLQQLHYDLLDTTLASHGGRLVDTAGDGAFTVFDQASGAAQAMVALLQRVSVENAHRPAEQQLRLRVGLHWGRVLSDGVHVTGDAVNRCARIAASAAPGQIRLSRACYQALDTGLRLRCRALGEVTLAGVDGPVALLGLAWRDPSRHPAAVRVRETGQHIGLPAQDLIAFGRLETQDGMRANDVVLTLPDPVASRQISRWHFELRHRPDGCLLRPLSGQLTEVDGQVVAQGQAVPVRPGTVVRLGGVMTLQLLADLGDDEPEDNQTIYHSVARPPGI